MTAGNGANVLFMYLHARIFQRAFVCFSLYHHVVVCAFVLQLSSLSPVTLLK